MLLLFLIWLIGTVLILFYLDLDKFKRKWKKKRKEKKKWQNINKLNLIEIERLTKENDQLLMDNKRMVAHYSHVLMMEGVLPKLIRWIDRQDTICAYVHKKADFKRIMDFSRRPVRDDFGEIKQYNLINFNIQMTLAERCPPELVAEQIGESVKKAILEQWYSDTLLLRDIYTEADYDRAKQRSLKGY